MTLELSSHRDADTVTVVVHGEVDLSTAEQLQQAIAAAVETDATDVRVDLTGVTFLDSAGINTLLRARRLADMHDRQFRVVNATGLIRDLLEMTGVWTHLSNPSA